MQAAVAGRILLPKAFESFKGFAGCSHSLQTWGGVQGKVHESFRKRGQRQQGVTVSQHLLGSSLQVPSEANCVSSEWRTRRQWGTRGSAHWLQWLSAVPLYLLASGSFHRHLNDLSWSLCLISRSKNLPVRQSHSNPFNQLVALTFHK